MVQSYSTYWVQLKLPAPIKVVTMIRLGDLSTFAYEVAGEVFIKDDHTLFIKDFVYNGNGPDAFFYVGTTGTPNGNGVHLMYPEGA